MDTITTKDEFGRPIPPVEGRLPVRYHIYWAGSDKDGAVVGFYWAVTETLATAPAPGFPIPELPGPKARDYHFTSRSDTTFVFNVSVDSPEREHGFYVYSIDDKGKVDPTPAKLTFRAYDKFPPIPIIDIARATGKIYELTPGGVTSQTRSYDVHGTFTAGNPVPVDVVPSGAVLTFAWHAVKPLATSLCVGYRYKLDEPTFITVDSLVQSVTYNTGVGGDFVPPGVKKFTLQALAQSGAHGDSTRFFQMNFEPSSWYSGPDTNSTFWTTTTDGNGNRYWSRAITAPAPTTLSWAAFAAAGGVSGTLLSSDSVTVLPALRPNRRTFFEIYAHRLYAHAEGDTVNLNSWVILPGGGLDEDSPYAVKVGIDPSRPDGVVTTAGTPNGSPIGFRQLVYTRKPDLAVVSPTESTVYPVFDYNSAYRLPIISPYIPMTSTGKAYAYSISQDGDNAVDRRIERAGGPLKVVDTYDRDFVSNPNIGPVTPAIAAARPGMMVFYVNHKPYLKTWDAQFSPRLDGSSSYRRGASTTFNLLADDPDPIDYNNTPPAVGGPADGASPVLVYTITLVGKTTDNVDTTWTVATSASGPNFPYTLPLNIQVGSATLYVTLCDFRPADAIGGDYGRCADTIAFPIQITATEPVVPSYMNIDPTHRPGSPAEGRRQQP